MKEPSEISCLIVDNGMFFGMAQQLAKSYKQVLYHNPTWDRGSCSCRDGCIGDGFQPEVKMCPDIWTAKKEYDLVIFPDNGNGGLQLELESQGKLVWGSRLGDSIERLRGKFLKVLKDVGLNVPKYHPVTGLSELRKYLSTVEDRFIKISKWRTDMETWHHHNIKLSRQPLDDLAIKFGPLQDEVPFMVFEPIETDIEIGYDGYSIDGWYPDVAVHGIEKKAKAYIGAIQMYDDLPEQAREVNNRMSDVLASYHYRNFWSSEIRIRDDDFWFIDPTCRVGMPSGDAQFVLYKNLAEIILYGATGETVEPIYENKFVGQVMITHDGSEAVWRDIQVPDEVMPYVRLFSPVKVGDVYGISPSSGTESTIGSVLGEGKTLEEMIKHVHENVEKLKDNPVTIDVESLNDVLKEMQQAADLGVKMTNEPIPDPAEILA